MSERRYQREIRNTNIALKRAKAGNWIAIVIGALAIIISILCACLIPVKIKESQHKELIETIKSPYNE